MKTINLNQTILNLQSQLQEADNTNWDDDNNWVLYKHTKQSLEWELKIALPTTPSSWDGDAILAYWKAVPPSYSHEQEMETFRLSGGLNGEEDSLFIQILCSDEHGGIWWEDWGDYLWEIPEVVIRSDYRPEDDLPNKDLFEVFKNML